MNRFCFRTKSSRDFFCSISLFDSSFSWLDTTFLEFFFTSASSSRIGLPLNRVNRGQISARFSVSRIEEEKFADARLYICNFAIYRRSVRFQGCIVQPPTLSLASPPVHHPRKIDLSFDSIALLHLSVALSRDKIESKSNDRD